MSARPETPQKVQSDLETVKLLIPKQLERHRFILVKPRSKEAFEKDWQNTSNYAYDDPKLREHLQSGNNYGVLAGAMHAIVECDDPQLEKLIERELPPPFT